MVELGKFFEFFKLKLPVWAGIAVALALFLFLPEGAANQMGFQKLRTQYKSYAACAFLITASLVVVQLSVDVFKFCSKKYRQRAWRKAAIKRLGMLSTAE